MRVLVTGAKGLVGSHVAKAMRLVHGPGIELVLTSKAGTASDVTLDVTNRNQVDRIIRRHRPTHVLHLAGIAAPSIAASDPEIAWIVNLQGTLNVAHAILAIAPDCCLVNAGSGLVYGESAKTGQALDENCVLAPMDAYGATKAAADIALGALTHRGLKCIRMRPFNHVGPEQSEDFVAPAFAAQIARIEAGLVDPTLNVGDLNAERDFLDVRDVASAYALAVLHSDIIPPGTILNVASGKARRISEVLDILLSISSTEIQVAQDPARLRPSDVPRLVGNAQKAQNLLGWSPQYEFEQTLADLLADCRERVKKH
ncbi:GDP-mannose 4,6-dehydratase [Pelagibacterium halotolerans]|uniref:GDP-mannose 4,6-dehydratase n=1 Tax=Pelagibacterium halotolerans TaxID=531813 RepID=UPI00384BECC3